MYMRDTSALLSSIAAAQSPAQEPGEREAASMVANEPLSVRHWATAEFQAQFDCHAQDVLTTLTSKPNGALEFLQSTGFLNSRGQLSRSFGGLD